MNKDMLRSIVVLHGDTQEILAKSIDITPQRFSSKINEKNGAEFTQSEINSIKKRYDLNADEVDRIFFEKEVS